MIKDDLVDPVSIGWMLFSAIVGLRKRTKKRRQIYAWLNEVTPVKKQLLLACVLAAKTSNRRIVEWRLDGPEPALFNKECALLLKNRAVFIMKYPPPGKIRYRFKPWMFDYLEAHMELLEAGDGVAAGLEIAAPGKESVGLRFKPLFPSVNPPRADGLVIGRVVREEQATGAAEERPQG